MLRIVFVLLIWLIMLSSIAFGALVDNGDGTVTDAGSDLMWQKQGSSNTMTWRRALNYCDDLMLSSYDDWRLPTLAELKSLIDSKGLDPAINTEFFPKTFSSTYWTSTTFQYRTDGAWYVSFYNGNKGVEAKSESLHVRAVRSVPRQKRVILKPTTFHTPELEDIPLRHMALVEHLGDGYILIRKDVRLEEGKTVSKKGILNADGDIFIDPAYDQIESFGKYFLVRKGKSANLLRRDGTLVFDEFHEHISRFENGFSVVKHCYKKEGLFDEKGRLLGDRWFKRVGPMRDGLAHVVTDEGAGYMRPDGSLVKDLSTEYFGGSDFSHGYAVLRKDDGFVYINDKLEVVSPDTYRAAEPFSEGFAAVRGQNGYYFVDTRFKPLGRHMFKLAYSFQDGVALVGEAGGTYNYISSKGNLILEQWFKLGEIWLNFQEGFCKIEKDGKYNFIDNRGEILSKDQWFDYVLPFENGYSIVGKQNKENFLGRDGKLVSNIWFDDIKELAEGQIPLLSYRYLLINGYEANLWDEKNNRIAFERWFERVNSAQRLLDVTYPTRETMLLDWRGIPVLPDKLSTVYEGSYGYFHITSLNGKENLIDVLSSKGELISKEWFDSVSNFSHGKQCIKVRRKKLKNLMFTDGSFFVDPWSDDIKTVWEGDRMHAVKTEKGYLVVDDSCHAIADEHFDRVETRVIGGPRPYFCGRKNQKWFRFGADGVLKPTAYDQCFQ
jgi:hypothetical protein